MQKYSKENLINLHLDRSRDNYVAGCINMGPALLRQSEFIE